jgi:hypothetical protein
MVRFFSWLLLKLKLLLSSLTRSVHQRLLYDQIVLFGDSITEFCDDQERGFNLGPALRNGACNYPALLPL